MLVVKVTRPILAILHDDYKYLLYGYSWAEGIPSSYQPWSFIH
jgi:hypothetical protein